jgi:hypothetical protein
MKIKNLIAEITAFEEGEMPEHEQVGFFAYLYNTGILKSLQGYYGRTFADHVSNGDITFEGATAVTRF